MELEEEKKRKLIKWLIIGIVIILILWLIITFWPSGDQNALDDYINATATYEAPGSGLTSTLFSINLDSEDASTINQEIENKYNTAIQNRYQQFTYEASLNKDYLSVALITNQINASTGYAYSTIDTYTFDLDSESLVTDDELLQTFSTSWEEIASSFEQEMQNFYQEELKSMYFLESDCNYQCFLNNREITSYQDNLHLFVLNDQLMYYRPFNIFSRWNEEDFYRYEDFLFEIR